MKAVGVALSFLLFAFFANGQTQAPPSQGALSPSEYDRFQQLSARRVHQLEGHVNLAEYMDLRRLATIDAIPAPDESIIHYALKNLGQKYKRDAYIFDLLRADCVTWSERVISLALTDNWEDAYRLQYRLRFRDGVRQSVNLNHYPIADWLPNNAWLFDDITGQLGVETATLDVITNRREKFLRQIDDADNREELVDLANSVPGFESSLMTNFIPPDALEGAFAQLRSGDVAFFIGNYIDRDDPQRRPRCFHEGIIRVVNGEVRVLHCVDPEAAEWSLTAFITSRVARDRFVGMKFARLRPNAYRLVQDELDRTGMQSVPPSAIDQRLGTRGMTDDGVVLVRATREPDEEVVIGDLVYGAIDIRQDESLWKLFTARWEYVYSLPVNQGFRAANPDPSVVRPVPPPEERLESGWQEGHTRIFYPIRRAEP